MITGPTAAGKSAYAIETAERIQGEIISADSRLVYRYLDIGTGKPSEYDLIRVPHHLVNVRTPDESFNISDFLTLAHCAIGDIHRRGRRAVIAGGTCLYIHALMESYLPIVPPDPTIRDYYHRIQNEKGISFIYQKLADVDPQSAAVIHPHDAVRIIRALEVIETSRIPLSRLKQKHPPAYSFKKIGLIVKRRPLYERIERRVDQMIADGLINEVKKIRSLGYNKNNKALQTIGYQEVWKYLDEDIAFEPMVDLIKKNTRNFAKRQMTWLRRFDGFTWIDSDTGCEITGPLSERREY